MTHAKLVLIASDHAGVALKGEIQKLLPNWEWMDPVSYYTSDAADE